MVTVFVAVAEALILCLGMQRNYLFPSNDVSDLYTRYADTPGVDASFIKDFRINDTVSVDVTLLEAVDSNGWNILVRDFAIAPLDSVSQRKVDNGRDLISTRRLNKNNYSNPINSRMEDDVIRSVAHLSKTVSVFHTKNEKERRAVNFYNYDKNINQNEK